MSRQSMKPPDPTTPQLITDYEGIVDITPVAGGERVEIAFDPAQLSENAIRHIALEHIQPAPGVQRCVLRLDGQACEAAAAKLVSSWRQSDDRAALMRRFCLRIGRSM